jgi:hypothetical protein
VGDGELYQEQQSFRLLVVFILKNTGSRLEIARRRVEDDLQLFNEAILVHGGISLVCVDVGVAVPARAARRNDKAEPTSGQQWCYRLLIQCCRALPTRFETVQISEAIFFAMDFELMFEMLHFLKKI